MNDNAANLRRDLVLPPDDVAFLNASHPGWQTVRDGKACWLMISNYSVPEGYNHQVVTAVLRLEPGYPDTQIDMVFFSPQLTRTDGVTIPATGAQRSINGESFQRWSRHRSAQNPWRPGEDNIESHMLLVQHWLEREFKK